MNLLSLQDTSTIELKGKHGFRYVELFAGIGGVSFGFDKLGGTCMLAAEYDPTAKRRQFAQEAYHILHPDTPLKGDVTKLNAKEVPDCDILSFTTPCQSFSFAGKRLGFNDIRGTLVFEALRIAKEKMPKVLFMENVKGLLSHDKGKTFETILHAMNDIGYLVDFNVLNSMNFGVAQRRERVFIVAFRKDLLKEEPWKIDSSDLPIVKRIRKKLMAISEDDENYIHTYALNWPKPYKNNVSIHDILEKNVDEKYYLNDMNIIKLANKLDESSLSKFNTIENDRIIQLNGPRSTPGLSINDNCAYTIPSNPMSDRGQLLQEILKPNSEINKIMEQEVKSIISKTRPNNKDDIGVSFKTNGDIRPHKLDSRKSGISELSINLDTNLSNTVTSSHAPKIYGETTNYRIRKLTPLECFRLQGFSDESYYKLVDSGFSDSRLYKFIGNAVTVNVIKSIGEQILEKINYLEDNSTYCKYINN